MKQISFTHCGVHVVIAITDDGDARLLHVAPYPLHPERITEAAAGAFRLVEIHAAGHDPRAHHGAKYVGTSPARLLRYQEHRLVSGPLGQRLEIILATAEVRALIQWDLIADLPVIRCCTTVENFGTTSLCLEYVSSFTMNGLSKDGLLPVEDQLRIHTPFNAWYGECQWHTARMSEIGLTPVAGFSPRRHSVSMTGTWSSAGVLPMAAISNLESATTLAFQIEHQGSWQWEMSDANGHWYVQVSGPTANENRWWQEIATGSTFTSAPVAVTFVNGGLPEAAAALNTYRRRIRRDNHDNRTLPVIFNDYMNCLWGDPTTAKILPLIAAAKAVGCEYYVIDAGWYDDGNWWDRVGAWEPSAMRFPGGIAEPLQVIREAGMIPGLWLELEVVGVECSLAAQLPNECFFQRRGRRVIDHGRYQLDFRHPATIAHANAVMERVVETYGVGYIKMDYNINAGAGTEREADSDGAGLLGHQRAYLAWLDQVFARWPQLVIENCGSGGLRMDYAMLQRHSLQSTSDQTDWRKMAAIAAAVHTAVTPEQAASWAYPLATDGVDAVAANMVTVLLSRILLSGQISQLPPANHAVVAEGIAWYKKNRALIPRSTPIWPLGIPHIGDGWLCHGLQCTIPGIHTANHYATQRIFLAVWRIDGHEDLINVPLPAGRNRTVTVALGYPLSAQTETTLRWNEPTALLSVRLPRQQSACLIELTLGASLLT